MRGRPEFSVLSVALRARLELPGRPWAGPEASLADLPVSSSAACGDVGTKQVLAGG